MSIPALSADASLYRTGRNYRQQIGGSSLFAVVPQLQISGIDRTTGDRWRGECQKDGKSTPGQIRSCCNGKETGCKNDCPSGGPSGINCRGHCKQRGDVCRGTLGSQPKGPSAPPSGPIAR
jgi:hypothetical protein